MATNLYDLFKPLSFPVPHAHFWLRHRCFLRVSPKPSSSVASSHSGIGAFLWISPEPSSLRPLGLCLLSVFGTCCYLWPLACFCTHLMFNISFCCCRHNVSNIFVQLTEGRSARDQPKQPPAKKWTVTWRNCIPLDGVHPQSREGHTDSATVQGHLVHPSVWAPGETNKVNDTLVAC